MVRRGRPTKLAPDLVRVDLTIPKADADALLRLSPEGYRHGLREALRQYLKQSIDWVDHQLRLEDDRHAEARAYLHDLRLLADKKQLSFSDEQLRRLSARAKQVSLLTFDSRLHRNWALAVGFAEHEIDATTEYLRELLAR